jgi:hypothetical protein
MTVKTITANCAECESSFDIQYAEELVSQDMPEHCPFCGEVIDDVVEEDYIDDDDYLHENEEWE